MGIGAAAWLTATGAKAADGGLLDWATNHGKYMPHSHCLMKADGTPDWFWISFLIGCTVVVIAAYLRIYAFWMKCYFAEEKSTRNVKLRQLGNLFFICASTGYLFSIALWFWPGYRLNALFFVVLVGAAVHFAWNLKPFEVTFAAVRLNRELSATKQLVDLQNQQMQLVLENMGQGFITVDMAGSMSGHRSLVLRQWLGGEGKDGDKIWDYLSQEDEGRREWLKVCWEMLSDDLMPIELALEQMPRHIDVGERTLELAYRPIHEGDTTRHILLVIDDVTVALQQERAEMLQKEVIAVFEKSMSDRAGVLAFYEEATRMIQNLRDAKHATRREELRDIHTLKGNCGVFGVRSVAEFCHDLETQLSETTGRMTDKDRLELERLWQGLSTMLSALLGKEQATELAVDNADYDRLVQAVIEQVPHDKLFRILRTWQFESTHLHLKRLAVQGDALAKRLGRAGIDFTIEAHGLRLPSDRWSPFWAACTHLVRNAADHGLEAADERRAAGKPEKGQWKLSTRIVDDELEVAIQDDGPGIQWEKVRAKADERGMSYEGDGLQQVLFADGFSSRDEVSNVSGRGVGMGAVRAAVERLGGRIELVSETGRGTRWTFYFKRAALGSPRAVPPNRAVSLRPSSLLRVPAHSIYPSWPVGAAQ